MKNFALVLSIVTLNLGGAVCMEYASNLPQTEVFLILFLMGVFLFLNVMKFGLWGYIHSKIPLSVSYPVAALFFPLIYIIAVYQGDAQWELNKILGACIIFGGAILVNKE